MVSSGEVESRFAIRSALLFFVPESQTFTPSFASQGRV